MAIYKLGSSGGEVARIQARLKELGLYPGPLDGALDAGMLKSEPKPPAK